MQDFDPANVRLGSIVRITAPQHWHPLHPNQQTLPSLTVSAFHRPKLGSTTPWLRRSRATCRAANKRNGKPFANQETFNRLVAAGPDVHFRAEPCRSLLSCSAVSSPYRRVYSVITIHKFTSSTSSSSLVSLVGSVMGKKNPHSYLSYVR